MKLKLKPSGKMFLGLTTMGEKGQVVVPAEARKRLALEKGGKLFVFGPEENMLVLVKADGLEKFAAGLAKKLEAVNEVIKKNKI